VDAHQRQPLGALVALDDLVGDAGEGALQLARPRNHIRPGLRVHGEFVVRADSVVVIREVLLDHPGTQRDRAEHGCVPVGVVRQPQDQVWKHGGVGFEHIEVDMIEVGLAGCIVGVAL